MVKYKTKLSKQYAHNLENKPAELSMKAQEIREDYKNSKPKFGNNFRSPVPKALAKNSRNKKPLPTIREEALDTNTFATPRREPEIIN